jgi:flagellar motor switch protein FliM
VDWERVTAGMSAEQMTSLVQRKARSARDAHAARAMSLGRALRLTAAKQADLLMKLALSTLGVTRRAVGGGDDTAACFEPDWLILLMDGPGTQVGAIVLDPALVTGLIQQQTMGKVTPVPEGGASRRHTATDAALCAPFIEALLSRAALLAEEERDRALLHGYRFGVWVEDPRKAQMALDSPDHVIVEMTLDMAAGTRTGKIVLVLPEPARSQAEPDSDPDAAAPPAQTLARTVMGLHAELTVALTRIRLPLQKVTALKAGDLLNLNLSTMAQAIVLDTNGREISRGTLGQIGGMRALQVEQQNTRQYSEPRRRATDREGLDLPDVTAPPKPEAPAPELRRKADIKDPAPEVPRLSDVDIFGNLDDLPGLHTANEDPVSQWDMPEDAAPSAQGGDGLKQAGW